MRSKKPTKVDLVQEIMNTPSLLPSPFNPSKLKKADLEKILSAGRSTDNNTGNIFPKVTVNTPVAEPETDGSLHAPNETHAHPSPITHSPVLSPCAHTYSPAVSPTPVELGSEVTSNTIQAAGSATTSHHADTGAMDGSGMAAYKRSMDFDLKLYIQDLRITHGIHKNRVQHISVKANQLDDNPGQKVARIQTCDILREIQNSYTPITGNETVQIGVADPYNANFTEVFAQAAPDDLVTAPHNPCSFVICYDDNRMPSLSLRIDFTAATNPLPHNLQSDLNAHELLIDWLKTKASERPGYEKFVQRRHTTMQNHAVVEMWAFAAQFSSAFFRQRHRFDTRSTILKKDIYAALGVRETWLMQAEEGYRIVQKFGEAGECRSQEIVDRLNEINDPPEGSVRLFQYLKNWDRDLSHHPPM
ncbi:hypothetical protein D9619_002514 [Psilocybe cf. subviscida]|uniref:Uncharacterized protein n=1 Tax=Psilocybe cf. subviscida TaxID=2480587 RepID=A0A8H5AW71_9AGAR|nr:hypothetical protein D9619_002514 [Psilocybe cf. subviscida]